MKIVADKNVPFLEGVFEPYAEVVYMGGADISKEVLSIQLLSQITVTNTMQKFLKVVYLVCSSRDGNSKVKLKTLSKQVVCTTEHMLHFL